MSLQSRNGATTRRAVEPRAHGGLCRRGVGWLALLLFVNLAPPALANTEIEGAVSAFTAVNLAPAGPSVRGGVALDTMVMHAQGPHRLNAGYDIRMTQSFRTSLSTTVGVGGRSGYAWLHPGGRYDLDVGHRITTVNRSNNLFLDDINYDAQQTFNGGVGVNFRPGSRTRLRISGRGGANYNQGFTPAGQTLNGTVTLSHLLRPNTTATTSVARTLTFDGSTTANTQIDSVQGQLERSLRRNGRLVVGGGVSEVRSDNTTVVVGTGLARWRWHTLRSQWTLGYDRSVTSSLIELTLAEVLQFGPDMDEDLAFLLEEEVVVISGLVVRDALTADYQNDHLCRLCRWQVDGRVAQEESLFTSAVTVTLDVGTRIGLQLTPREEIGVGYRSQWESDAVTVDPDQQLQRVNGFWRREVAENSELSAEISHSRLSGVRNEHRSTVQVSARYGLY